jgi:hypothetical protein
MYYIRNRQPALAASWSDLVLFLLCDSPKLKPSDFKARRVSAFLNNSAGYLCARNKTNDPRERLYAEAGTLSMTSSDCSLVVRRSGFEMPLWPVHLYVCSGAISPLSPRSASLTINISTNADAYCFISSPHISASATRTTSSSDWMILLFKRDEKEVDLIRQQLASMHMDKKQKEDVLVHHNDEVTGSLSSTTYLHMTGVGAA